MSDINNMSDTVKKESDTPKKSRGRPCKPDTTENQRQYRKEKYLESKTLIDEDTGATLYEMALARQREYAVQRKVMCNVCNKLVFKHYMDKHENTQKHKKLAIYDTDVNNMTKEDRITYLENKLNEYLKKNFDMSDKDDSD